MIKLNSKIHKIYFVSDLHLNHTNYCLGVSKWGDKSKCRNFPDIQTMNDVILSSLLELPEDAYLFILGDTIFGENKNYYSFFEKLKVKNIIYIFGNHCNRKLFTEQSINFNLLNKDIIGSELIKINIDKHNILLSHYPLLSWEDMDRTIMLHGHTHGSVEYPENFVDRLHSGYKPKILDVGIDNYFKLYGEYKVFLYEEIKNLLNIN
jgi:calcineurin-like phosphoesterase family protein